MNSGALYLVKLIFDYPCYFDSNRVAALWHLQLYLGTNRVPVRERVKTLVSPGKRNPTVRKARLRGCFS